MRAKVRIPAKLKAGYLFGFFITLKLLMFVDLLVFYKLHYVICVLLNKKKFLKGQNFHKFGWQFLLDSATYCSIY